MDNAAVTEKACGAIWSMAVNAENKCKFKALSCISTLNTIISRYQSNEVIKKNASGALNSLTK